MQSKDYLAEDKHIMLRYQPSSDEVALLYTDSLVAEKSNKVRSVFFHLKGQGSCCFVQSLSRLYEPLRYVLLFPKGQLGWGVDNGKVLGVDSEGKAEVVQEEATRIYAVKRIGLDRLKGTAGKKKATRASGQKISLLRYLRQKAHNDEAVHLLCRLSCEYFCDMWLRHEEQEVLNWYRFGYGKNKDTHKRSASRTQANAAQKTMSSTGKIVLPAAFRAGKKARMKLVAYGLAVVRRLGKPTFFM